MTNENNPVQVWLGTLNSGVVKLTISLSAIIREVSYDTKNFGGSGFVLPVLNNDKLLFAAANGMFELTGDSGAQIFNYYKLNQNTFKGTIQAYTSDKNIDWICLNNRIAGYEKRGLIRNPFEGIYMGKVNILKLIKGKLFVGSDNAMLIYVLRDNRKYTQKIDCYLTRFFGGTDTVALESKNDAIVPEIEYHNNYIEFEFAAPYYNANNINSYSWMLQGANNKWSEWSPFPRANLSNIPEGSYSFKVKAKNSYNIQSREARINFKILPPWYRTIWAYIIWFFLFILFVIEIIRINSIRLRNKNIRLEKIVKERTLEIVAKNKELKIKSDSIIDSIQYAKRIQQAILPPDNYFTESLPQHFIIYKPLHIVSGDFYWLRRIKFRENNEVTILAAADCTGHGVPGAFMSMLGSTLLNEIISQNTRNDYTSLNASGILNELRQRVIDILHQKSGENRDGMDSFTLHFRS